MVGSWITMYGALWCGDCKRAKKFLAEQRIQYSYVDVMQDADGLAFIERVTKSKQIVPIIACRFADERPRCLCSRG